FVGPAHYVFDSAAGDAGFGEVNARVDYFDCFVFDNSFCPAQTRVRLERAFGLVRQLSVEISAARAIVADKTCARELIQACLNHIHVGTASSGNGSGIDLRLPVERGLNAWKN